MLRKGVAKLADFGLAAARQSITGQVGALAYESPEQADRQPYDGRNDVWALGCVITELVTLQFVWRRIKQREIFAKNLPVVKDTLKEVSRRSTAWANLANWLLTVEKSLRPSSKQVHEYLAPKEEEIKSLVRSGQPQAAYIFTDASVSTPQPQPPINLQHSSYPPAATSYPPPPPTATYAATPAPAPPTTSAVYGPPGTQIHHSSESTQNIASPSRYQLSPNWEEDLQLKLTMLYSMVDSGKIGTIPALIEDLKHGRMSFVELKQKISTQYHKDLDVPNISDRLKIPSRRSSFGRQQNTQNPSMHAFKTMQITIPHGVQAGMELECITPTGKQVKIVIPERHGPGDRLTVKYKP